MHVTLLFKSALIAKFKVLAGVQCPSFSWSLPVAHRPNPPPARSCQTLPLLCFICLIYYLQVCSPRSHSTHASLPPTPCPCHLFLSPHHLHSHLIPFQSACLQLDFTNFALGLWSSHIKMANFISFSVLFFYIFISIQYSTFKIFMHFLSRIQLHIKTLGSVLPSFY